MNNYKIRKNQNNYLFAQNNKGNKRVFASPMINISRSSPKQKFQLLNFDICFTQQLIQ